MVSQRLGTLNDTGLRKRLSVKYRNTKTVIDGIEFASKREAKRYSELKLLERAGEIKALGLQVPFQLIEPMRICGKHHRAIIYIADFVYCQDGRRVVEDVKGFKTDVYNIKKRLMKSVHNIEIKEI